MGPPFFGLFEGDPRLGGAELPTHRFTSHLEQLLHRHKELTELLVQEEQQSHLILSTINVAYAERAKLNALEALGRRVLAVQLKQFLTAVSAHRSIS